METIELSVVHLFISGIEGLAPDEYVTTRIGTLADGSRLWYGPYNKVYQPHHSLPIDREKWGL